MVDRYAKFGTEHLAAAAVRIESRPHAPVPNDDGVKKRRVSKQTSRTVVKVEGNVIFTSRFPHVGKTKRGQRVS